MCFGLNWLLSRGILKQFWIFGPKTTALRVVSYVGISLVFVTQKLFLITQKK
jgi:hypothetical protein